MKFITNFIRTVLLFIGLYPIAGAPASRWKSFCERYIAAEDPYQFEDLTIDQLVYVYWSFRNAHHHSRALINEIQKRLDGYLSRDAREILQKTLNNEETNL